MKRRRCSIRGATNEGNHATRPDKYNRQAEGSSRWSELPRDLLGLVLRHAVTSANPLPFTGLCHWSDPDSCAYHRHDDLGQQYELPPSCSSCTQGSAAAEASQSAATASPASPQTHPCFRHRQQQQQHHQQQQQGHACRVSSTVLAMRLVCRTWCDVVGEGVRRVLVVDPAPLVIWAEHFPGLTHLALGPCADFSVQSPPPPPPPAPPPPRAQVPLKPRSELTPPQSQPRGQGDPSAWPGPVPGLQYVGGSGAPWLAADHQNGDNVGGTSMQQQQQLQQPQGCRSPNGSAMLPAGRPVSPQAASGSGTGNRPMLAHGGLVAAHFPANDARGDEAVAAQAAAVAAAAASPARLRSLRSASRRAADTAHGAKWTGPRVPATATLAQCPGLAGGQIAEGTYGTSGGGSRGKGKGAAGSTEGVRKGRKGASVGKKAGLSGRARKVDGAGGGSGAAETPCQAERSLAALKALRNLQIMDTTPHLDLASTATGLEELVVIAAAGGAAAATTSRQYGANANAGRRNASQWPPSSHSNDAEAGASGHAHVSTRRSALDRALAALSGLRRLRLAGADASAARLGSALMGLTGLSSLRLQHCRLPTFLGTSGGAAGGGGPGAGVAAGGSGSSGRGATAFGRQMVHNLGAKLLDLSLQSCSLRVLPCEALRPFSRLRSLDLSGNLMAELPLGVTELIHLEYLDLQRNLLVRLPVGLAALSRLADLDLSSNSLLRLPPDFGQLMGLTHLHLGCNQGLNLTTDVSMLARLTRLHSLGLCDIDLSDLDALLENPPPPPPPPHGAAALQPAGPPPPADGPAAVAPAANGVPHHQPFPAHAAGEFHLANVNGAAEPDSGPLAVLVSGLGGAGRLRELLLDGCCLRRLPASFSQLTALSHLSLMENYDSVGFPESVTCLRNLAILKLGYLDLAEPLPAGLWGALTGLRELDLEQNFLPGLSPEVSRLTNLQVLRLLDAFDPDDHPSHHLHHLQLQHNPHHMHNQLFAAIAAAGGGQPHPANGQRHALNNGHAGPPAADGTGGGDGEAAGEEGDVGPVPWRSLYCLTRLRQLAVTGSERPQRVPPGIGALTGLELLHLHHFHVPLPVLAELCGAATGLVSLDVSSCGLAGDLPPAVTGLGRLGELNLAHNALTRLPHGLGALSRLTDLALSHNPGLRSLPLDITRLRRLQCFSWTVPASPLPAGPPTTLPSRGRVAGGRSGGGGGAGTSTPRGSSSGSGEEQLLPAATLAWMSRVPELVLHGPQQLLAQQAAACGVSWPGDRYR